MTTMANNTYYKQLDTLDALEREIYRILNTFADNTTKQCFPSIETLSTLFKRCRKTTKKYLRILESKGFIHIQERKVKHKVTNNKFNETHRYTLLLEKFKGIIKKKTDDVKEKSNPIILEETDLDRIIRELSIVHNKESVSSALKCMRKNMRSGSIISNMKSYLETLISKSNGQLQQVNKAIESSTMVEKGSSNTKYQANKSNNKNEVRTKFHNFEQRTSNYNADELEAKILANHKRK